MDKTAGKEEDREEESLKVSKKPGAARFGNFINYYQFNPPESRLELLPEDLTTLIKGENDNLITVLDVGCNAGNLSHAIYNRLETGGAKVRLLGVDIDPKLIERAQNGKKAQEEVEFIHLDLTGDQENVKGILDGYLKKHGRTRFDLICVFSVTMWIHLNNGDQGLRNFLSLICQYSRYLLLEPQPWKCYQTAARRMRKLGEAEFPLMSELKIRGENVDQEIINICQEEGDMDIVNKFGVTKWTRRLVMLKSRG